MTFIAPVGLTGRFTTVRLGDKWLKALRPGETVQMLDGEKGVLGTAKAMDIWNGDLAQVPASLCEMAHDPLMRTYSGLAMGMRVCYRDTPGAVIAPDTNVTVIVMEFQKPPGILRALRGGRG